MSSAAHVIRRLALQPHPEGGWYREVYRSRLQVHTSAGPRSAFTDIYYLLERGQLSRWHVVDADEAWHFHGGAPLQLYLYDPASGVLSVRSLDDPCAERQSAAGEPAAGGVAALAGEPAAVVPAGVWQAARSLGAFSLVGCSVAPAFQFSGFRFVAELPGHERHFDAPAGGPPAAATPSLQSLRDLL